MPTLNLVSEDSQLRDVIQQRIDKKHQANKKIKDREKEKGISTKRCCKAGKSSSLQWSWML